MKLDQGKNHIRFAEDRVEHTRKCINNYVLKICANVEPDYIGKVLNNLNTEIVNRALYSWYVDQDLVAAKQWFYVAAKCIAISTTKPRGATLWGCHDFMFALLSDNSEMIALFAELSPPEFSSKCQNPKDGEFQSYLAQTAIKRDDAKLQELLDLLKAKGLKKSLINAPYIQFYTGLIKGDIAEMETALAFLGGFRSQDPTTEDFLAFHAIVMCKLAWLRGYEVKVDSPLVPMAFMPVAPLAHYDDVYEFLKPDWVAPPPPK